MTAHIARRRRRDAGQAFPLYIVAVGGLLFLALAFFAVGQAAATRNGAQTAADAAALAAGQKYRDQLSTALLDAIRAGGGDDDASAWEDLVNGRGVPSAAACAAADWFAGQNDAAVSTCTPDSWPTSFAVTVKTRNTVGDSVIPGTENRHASAKAQSVVGPRCTIDTPPSDDGGPTGGTAGKDGAGGEGGKGGEGDTEDEGGEGKGDKPPPVTLLCDGRSWTLDPDKPQDLPDASDLFSVRLAR
ncbi:pilus assembly protein TadG-related protein [Streptomyces sp. NPDC017993]|uniref:pilus assembly protein TadG-related protein n=1 Tax=Streptomyces sp. NPDC017993 TaxID=3365027 RepID=UPI0037A74B47